MVSCKMPVEEFRTVKDYRELLVESMFFHAMNQRFFKISRKKDRSWHKTGQAGPPVDRQNIHT